MQGGANACVSVNRSSPGDSEQVELRWLDCNHEKFVCYDCCPSFMPSARAIPSSSIAANSNSSSAQSPTRMQLNPNWMLIFDPSTTLFFVRLMCHDCFYRRAAVALAWCPRGRDFSDNLPIFNIMMIRHTILSRRNHPRLLYASHWL